MSKIDISKYPPLPPTVPPTEEVLAVVRQKIRRKQMMDSLIEFSKEAWPIIEPGSKFVDNWHLHVIAEHLEAVTNGDIHDLLINIPPGCCKSILVSVMWPAWMWAKDPSKRVLGASYGEELAIRDSMKCRDIVTSSWYQELWPDVAIKQGDDQKIKYGLTGGGWRLATSVGGRATGEHPDIKIVDDPHSAAQANSDAERGRAIEWFDGTLSTRGVSRGAKTVVVMQRLHEKDVSGHILEDIGGYEHLCLPMRYEKNGYTSKYDERKREGDLLWPALFDDDTVTILQKRLGEYGAAGQLQQQPAPPGGGILRTENLKVWPAEKQLPPFQFILQSLDTAFTEKTSGDPTACTVWGVFSDGGVQSVMLLDSWAEHLSYPNLREKVIMEWAATYGGDPKDTQNKARRADLMLIEDKGSGISLIQDLQRAGIGVRKYNPGRTDKIGRAHQFAPMLELGVIYIPESRRVPGDFISWAKPLVSQMEKFPNAVHDDLCFSADTVIKLASGEGIVISSLRRGDWVSSPTGPQQVERAFCSNPSAEIVEVKLSNGVSLRGTWGHPVYSPKHSAFVRMGTLVAGDTVCTPLRSFTTEELITVDTLIVRAPLSAGTSMGSVTGRMKPFTAKSILTPLVTFLRDLTSTTKTKTLPTIPPTTLSASLAQSMVSVTAPLMRVSSQCISGLKLGSIVQRLRDLRSPQRSEFAFVAEGSTAPSRLIGLSFAPLNAATCITEAGLRNVFARYAGQAFKHLKGPLCALRNAVRSTVGAKKRLGISCATSHVKAATVPSSAFLSQGEVAHVVSVTPLPHREPVYNLTVSGNPVFLANGVLTHNCDTTTSAFIYLRDSRLLELSYSQVIDEEVEVDYHAKNVRAENPYMI